MPEQPPTDRVKAFSDSMVMNYKKWHDGEGYDIDLIAQMTDAEKAEVESLILGKGVNEWRDLEALQALNTSTATEALLKARESPNAELRLSAQQYGPQPRADDREAAILAALNATDIYDGLSEAIDEAAENPSHKIEKALLKIVRDLSGAEAYSAAAALYYIHGRIESHYGFENRDFFLRLAEPDGEDRKAAYEQLCKELGFELNQ